MSKRSSQSVVFQGENGAFSYLAARKFFGKDVKTIPCESFKEVFVAVDSGKAEYAVIPIENTLHGSVHENYDHLLEYDLRISSETNIRISHQLIALPGVRFKDIRQAFSHPVALNQCRRFFERHPSIVPTPFYDTAGSAKMLKETNAIRSAAIASEAAAEIYGGTILKRNIEDNRQNFTRFFLLTKHPLDSTNPAENWKTSLVFATANTPGALFRALACFALRDVNLAKIESRPLRRRPWEYLFYLDVLGSVQDDKVANAIKNLQEMTTFLKLLGSYRPTP